MLGSGLGNLTADFTDTEELSYQDIPNFPVSTVAGHKGALLAGRLEKRWVQTGRNLWGSYTQIRGGLTVDDFVAFPYGRDVVAGAGTTEATPDQLYNGM